MPNATPHEAPPEAPHAASDACAHCRAAPRLASYEGLPREARGVAAHPATGRPVFCAACLHAYYRDPARLAEAQTDDALRAFDRDPDAYVRWPFAAVDALAGPMAPGSVHYVAAASGGGKTTFITSVIRRWTASGVRVDVLPLETEAWAWRVHMACVAADVPPGLVLSGELPARAKQGDADAAATCERVRVELRRMRADAADGGCLAVHPDRHLTARRLRSLCAVAAKRGAQVVVVDHIDHVEADAGAGGRRADPFTESQRVNGAVLDAAVTHGLIVVAMSQLNAARFRGARDRLAKYGPPQTADLLMHTFKEHNAASILGLFRPLSPWADLDAVARARAGDAEPGTVLAAGVMGVVAGKLRHRGEAEGRRTYLTVERGAARDRTPDEARDWEAASQGIGTGEHERGRTGARRLGVVRGGAA